MVRYAVCSRPQGCPCAPGSRSRRRRLFSVLAALAALTVAGCGGAPRRTDPPPNQGASVFIVKRGWHIDVGVAVAALAPPLRTVQAQLPQARYLLFGFGDRRYLTARSKRLDALLAALRPGAALILLTGLTDTPQEAFGERSVRVLQLDARQMQALQAYIWRTLVHANGRPTRVQAGPYHDSAYLAAQPIYSALHTCNSWAAEALRSAALPVHDHGIIFAWQLWTQLPRLQRAERAMRAPLGAADRRRAARGTAVRSRPPQLQGGFEPSEQTTVV